MYVMTYIPTFVCTSIFYLNEYLQKGRSALYEAVYNNNIEMVQLLLSHGAINSVKSRNIVMHIYVYDDYRYLRVILM